MGRQEPVPLYYRVELWLRDAIANGQFRPDGRIPNEDALARMLRVSRATVRNALGRLEEDGEIVRYRARGTFVREPRPAAQVQRHLSDLLSFEEDILRAGVVAEVEVISVEWQSPAEWAAEALSAGREVELLHLRRLGKADGSPLWLESRYFAAEVGPSVRDQDLRSPSLSNLVQRVCGVRVMSTRVSVQAEAATEHVARLLRRPTGSPVLVCTFAFFDHEQRPLEAVRAIYPADRYTLHVDLSQRLTIPELTARLMGSAAN
ncbi:MAG: GntR family transcriptional regulator [Chloroflexota bacterium]